MANHHLHALAFGSFSDLLALPGGGGHGFFQEQVIALVDEGHGRGVVHIILGAHNGEVRHLGLGGKGFPGGKEQIVRDAVALLGGFPADGIGICHGYDFQFLGVRYGILGVSRASSTEAHHDCG